MKCRKKITGPVEVKPTGGYVNCNVVSYYCKYSSSFLNIINIDGAKNNFQVLSIAVS